MPPPSFQLKKPIVFLDIEATGVDVEHDRIVEICLIKRTPDGRREMLLERVNPGMLIPPEAIAIHGITDAELKDKPLFRALAPKILEFLGDADLCGYNILRFDAHMLANEMARSGLSLGLANRSVIDVMKIYHRLEPRDLSAAYKFYCSRDLKAAHTAQADTEAVEDILAAQLERYPDLPREMTELHEYCNVANPRFVDSTGRFAWRYNQAYFNFGKHRGKSLAQVAGEDRDYMVWLIEQGNLPDDAWAICRASLEGEFPQKS